MYLYALKFVSLEVEKLVFRKKLKHYILLFTFTPVYVYKTAKNYICTAPVILAENNFLSSSIIKTY